MKEYTLADLEFLEPIHVLGSSKDHVFVNAKSLPDADDRSLVWIKPSLENKREAAAKTKARIIICDESFRPDEELLGQKSFIVVKDPRLAFIRAVRKFFTTSPAWGIHPTAAVHPEARIHPESYIGPFTYVGKSTIGEGTVLYGHIHLYDNVEIGRNVVVHAGTVIGADGFGYQRNEKGEFEGFPHIGGVVIEDFVDIGAHTCIDRGTLGNTVIKTGAKIDNLVHIAHNVIVGKHAAVIAHAMVGGSTSIGDGSWIAPSAALLNGITIGTGATIGMAAVVTKNVPDGETWAGVPARPLSEFLNIQKKIRSLP